ncbi:MAG: helix-turn-helix domain-containing protein [Lachnospiraceae bacterium]
MDNTNLRKEIGKRVHDYRVQHGYTQAQFAEYMDISVNFISEIENGKKGMSQETLYRLCDYFGISADYILFGKENRFLEFTPNDIVDNTTKMSIEQLTALIKYLNSLKDLKNSGL